MATVVHKVSCRLVDITPDDRLKIEVPLGSEILTVAEQVPGSGSVQIWYRCDPKTPKVERHIHVVGTGHPAPVKAYARHLGTLFFHNNTLVLHFFDDGRLL